jgi:hypothetical protein
MQQTLDSIAFSVLITNIKYVNITIKFPSHSTPASPYLLSYGENTNSLKLSLGVGHLPTLLLLHPSSSRMLCEIILSGYACFLLSDSETQNKPFCRILLLAFRNKYHIKIVTSIHTLLYSCSTIRMLSAQVR